MSKYKPTVGQPVHVHLSRDYAQKLGATRYDDSPMAATVSYVHNPGTINVSALDHQGKQFTIRGLSFIPPGYEAFDLPLKYACLPPGEEAEVEEEEALVPMSCPFCMEFPDDPGAEEECIRKLQKEICAIPESPWTKKEPEEEYNEPDRDYGPPTQHGGEEYHEQKEYGMPQLDFYLDEEEAVTYLRSVPVRSLAEVPHEGWLVDLGLSDTYRVSDVKIQYLSTPLCAEVFLDEREKEPTTTPQEDWPEAALSNERWIYEPSTPQDKWNRIVDLMEDLVIDLMGRKLYEPAKVILEFFDSFVSGWNFQGIHLPGKEDEQ